MPLNQMPRKLKLKLKQLPWFMALGILACTGCSQLPSQDDSIANCPVSLKLSLSDTPGPSGHPLSYTPWKIAKGLPPDGLGMVEPSSLLAAGETDKEGIINLTNAEQINISNVFCKTKEKVWLVYPGQTVEVSVTDYASDWTENEELFHLLKAQSYFAGTKNYSPQLFEGDGVSELDNARKEYGASSNAELLEKLRQAVK